MNKVIITGGNGLVGSRIVEILSSKYQFEKVSRETGINITKSEEVLNFFKGSDSEVVIHMAAKADVEGCEADREVDEKALSSDDFSWEGSETAYGVNVYGTRNVTSAALQTGKKLIYISTDFVFDGEKEEPYVEEDSPNPINWYAQTKFLGEKEAFGAQDFVISRIAYPYRINFAKKDFVRAILSRFQSGEAVNAVTDHVMTPTYIDDIAIALDILVQSNQKGVFHVVGSSFVSPFEVSQKIAEIFGFDKNQISQTTRAEFFKARAPRPFHLALKNDKIARLGVQMRTFEEGLLEIKKEL